MPAPYYVDGSLGAGGSGSDVDPWGGAVGLQTMLDTLAAGEIGYVRGAVDLADGTRGGEENTALNVDNNPGTQTSPILLIGTAVDWSVDGTRVVIDGNAAAPNVMLFNEDFWGFCNLTYYDATGDGMTAGAASSDYCLWYNCRFTGNDGVGLDTKGTATYSHQIVFCEFDNNGSYGLHAKSYNHIVLCEAHNNGSNGFYLEGISNVIISSLVYANGGRGVRVYGSSNLLMNLIADGVTGTDGIETVRFPHVNIGCRLTNNNGDGLEMAHGLALFNYANGNGVNFDLGANVIQSFLDTANTNSASGLQGYRDRTGNDLSAIMGAAMKRNEITFPGGTRMTMAAGLPYEPLVRPREN